MQRVIEAFHARLEHTLQIAADRVLAAKIPFYIGMPRETVVNAIRRVYLTVGQDLEHGGPRAFPALMAMLGEQRSSLGIAVSQILVGMNIGFETTSEDLAAHFADDPEARIHWEQTRARISYAGATALADAYMAAREKVVRAQADEIVRLSTQVLPLYEGIVVFPLVGTIDTARAQTILGVLLEVVRKHAAKVVLIDISGVPVVDAEAATHLSRTARAVALLGAQAILVGTSAEVARTMITANVNLGELQTLATLESGLKHALKLIGRKITAG